MNLRSSFLVACALCMVQSCAGGSQISTLDAADVPAADVAAAGDVRFGEQQTDDALEARGNHAADLRLDGEIGPACAPGEGCFLDPCTANESCQSGWCVEHMGNGVCTQTCQEECPDGWDCKPVGGGPDVVYICVSRFSNLCKPCATTEGCKSVGADDVCVSYGQEGSFCGGPCANAGDCPWGFTCKEALTVDGVPTTQCISDTGVCPCAARSVELSLTTPCGRENEFGTCEGKRVCTAEGLTDCDALIPEAESCDGIDNDCNGLVDDGSCDDGNDCTSDSCKGKDGCVNEALDEGECKDNDPCTVADHCVAGVCVGAAVECNDKNPCTDDVCTATGGCEFPPLSGPCDDLDPCTVADQCSGGACAGTPVACDCKSNSDCAVLEDGDACNGTLECDLSKLPYLCRVAQDTIVTCPAPQGSDAPCLAAQCAPSSGQCSLVPSADGAPCSDGSSCTYDDQCLAGKCTGGPALNCNDGNPCTDDSCLPAGGCLHANNAKPCSDDDVCTTGDVCLDGGCKPGLPLKCDDGNVCNGTESCDQAVGCKPGVSLVCDDQDPCNGLETCHPTLGCQAGVGGSCDDGNPCSVDGCNAQGGCQHVPDDGQPCSDENLCTTGDHCEAGVCKSTGKLSCTDDNPCTDNLCDPAVGCMTNLNSAPCNDGNLCTTGDHCHLGGCISSGELTCNDSNPCTTDACVPAIGCTFTANTAACDDGNKCTSEDHCSGGWCSGEAVSCDDANPCTDDTCAKDLGCVHSFNLKPCEDGDPCSVNDKCSNGLCTPGTPADCDDGNPCTDDTCSGQGCIYIANKGGCDDKNACTSNDYCVDAKCVPGTPVTCNDNNVCTDDSCVPESGCRFDANTKTCDDLNLCTQNDKCVDKKCVGGTPLGCDDAVPCTQDICEPLVGCVHIASNCCGNNSVEPGEDCDDGNVKPGDGCNEACQYESFTYTIPFTPDDFDVSYDRRMAAVGREGSNVVGQCYGLNRQPVGGKFTVLQAPAGAVVEHVHMAMAGQTGYFGVFVRHQTVAGDWASRRMSFRLYNSQCQPVTAAFVVDPNESADEGRDIDLDEKGNAYLAWMGKDKKMYLAIVAPDGTYKLAPKNFGTCQFNFSLQLAVQPNSSRGVITCQGHDSNPIWFWLFDSQGNFDKSQVQVQGAPPSSWYFSHEVGINAAGRFVILWAANSVAQFKANFYDENGTLVAQTSAGSTTAGSCYDPFRDDNTKIQSPGGDFVLPYVLPQDGPCYLAKHHGFHRMSPSGQSVKSGTSPYLMHTLVMDNFGSTYVRDGSKIRLNAVSVK